jgi:heterogeneous nuclear rnp K-like protein 2
VRWLHASQNYVTDPDPQHSQAIPTMSAEESQAGAGQDANRVAEQLDRLNMDGEADVTPRTEQEYADSQLTLRAIVSSKEAGVIIGKAGKNVADLRDETGVRAGVSKVVQGVHDRVLSVTGSLSGISKAYGLVAKGLLDGAPAMGMGGVVRTDGTHRTLLHTLLPYIQCKLTYPAIRLLISHNQMGTIIGRQGLKIKQIQDASGVRMVAQKEMLPQSTERVVEVQGSPGGIEKAIWEIGKCLIDDSERGYGTVLYNPAVRVQPGAGPAPPTNGGAPAGAMGGGRSYNRTGNGADFSDAPAPAYSRRSGSDAASRPPPPTHDEDGVELQTQNISIPSDMVGCIIGRGGSKISEIRKTSGARISIAKAPHDDTGERMFTITGSASANEKALYLLYENLEAEKMRRSQAQE